MVPFVLLLLTIGLVVVGAIALVFGFVQDSPGPIYISIACSVLAGVVLFVFSRMSRQPAGAAAGSSGATPSPSFSAEEAGEPTQAIAATPAAGEWSDEGEFPIADYDELLVTEIVPLLSELELDELDLVREREQSGKARSSILRRVDALIAEREAEAPAEDEIGDDLAVAGALDDVAGDDDDELFPIEDYDDLRVNEIVPLLPELYDDELEVVAERERQGANRATILNRIEELLSESEEPAPAPVKKTAAKKATATGRSTTRAAAKG